VTSGGKMLTPRRIARTCNISGAATKCGARSRPDTTEQIKYQLFSRSRCSLGGYEVSVTDIQGVEIVDSGFQLPEIVSRQNSVNLLKPKLVYIIFKNSVRTAKKPQHFTITKNDLSMLFKEIIAVYCENYTKHVSTKCSVTNCWSRWYI
jgi:hypothetical protein